MKIHGHSQRLEKQLEEQQAQIERLESELNFFKRELSSIQERDEDSKEVINKIATSILGKSDYLEIAWDLVNIIPQFLNCGDCIFYLVDEEDQELSQIAAYGEKIYNGEITNHLTIPLGKGIVGTVAQTAIPELIHDTSQDARYIADLDRNYSEITVPILFDGKVIGVLDCEAPPKNFFSVKQLSTLMNVSSLIGLQLNNVLNLKRLKEAEEAAQNLNAVLQKRNDELEQYARIVSHDLKSPLRGLFSLFHWIKNDNIDQVSESSLEHFDHVERTLTHMDNLISSLLEYSSLDTEKENLESFSLLSLVDDLLVTMSVPEHIMVKIEIAEDLMIKAFKVHFVQIFQNLISNSLKYIDKDKGLLIIRAQVQNGFYRLEVEDNGMGISMDQREKIFQLFRTAGNSKDETGVGLSIVQKIVQLNEGYIWLESTPGEGAHFFVEIPE
jgi:signal transduction histidine kinase